MSELRDMLLEAFWFESREHVEGVRAALGRQAGKAVDLEEAFRRVHSLKGAARVCDLEPAVQVSQRLESLFGRARQPSRDGTLDAKAIHVVLLAVGALEGWIQALQAKEPEPSLAPAIEALDGLLAEVPEPAPAVQAVQRAPEGPAQVPTGSPTGLEREVFEAFLIEHREHLEGIRAMLADAEEGGIQPAQVDDIFRRAHSLKGAARIAEMRPAEVVAHRLESLFAEARAGRELTPAAIRAVQGGLNFIEDAVVGILNGNQAPDPTEALRAIDQALGDPGDAAGHAPPSVATPGPAPEPAPEPPEARRGERSEAKRAGPGRNEEQGPAGVAPQAPEPRRGERSAAERAGAGRIEGEAVRVSTDHINQLLRSVEHLLTEGLNQDRVLRELTEIERRVNALSREGQSVRVEAARVRNGKAGGPQASAGQENWVLHHLHQVEEQVRALARQVRRTRRMHQHASYTLRQLGRQLQQDVRRVRTVPAESVFQGFRKMMRDLARDQGKEVDFRLTGLEVQADRLVLQALKDPLMHVLRNAVTHGIEPPEERQRVGKPQTGVVTLLLRVRGNRLHIQVEDDGRGIDARRVAEEAVGQGLLTADQAAAADPDELSRLLFQPGFSTAGAVTDLAGRGMGLSIVQEAVSRLLGEIRLRPPRTGSRAQGLAGAPSGTRILLSVPLSVSTQRLLLVTAGDQTFAVPFSGIEELHRVRREEVEDVAGRPMLMLRGSGEEGGAYEPVPFRTLAGLLGLAVEQASDAVLPVIVLRSGSRRLAVAVDTLLGESHTLLRDLDVPARADTWAGGILLEDGSVCLVVNPAALFRVSGSARAQAQAPAVPRRPAPRRAPTVLVVDDSLTTRTLEKSILEAHGYTVRVALDGLEALNQLHLNPADLVITDIQMPRLDGFGLLEAMKKDNRLAQIPVIVVTSLEKREDQERGLALGADAYVVKRKFDHEELLQTIRQLL